MITKELEVYTCHEHRPFAQWRSFRFRVGVFCFVRSVSI